MRRKDHGIGTQVDLPGPKGETLPALTLAWLKRALREGRWEGVLPPERKLAFELRVSRAVLRRALEELVKEGWISKETRRPARILGPFPGEKVGKKEVRRRRVVLLSPRPLPMLAAGSAADLYRRLLHEAIEQGHRLIDLHDPRLEGEGAAALLEEMVVEYPQSVWILMGVPEPVQRFFALSGEAAIVLGHRFAGVELCAVDLDTNAVCWHAGTQLLRAGCRHVALFLVSERRAGDQAAREGFLRAMTGASQREGEAKVEWSVEVVTGREQAVRKLRSLAATGARPCGVIVVYSPLVIALACEALALGWELQRDWFLVSMYDDPVFSMLPERIPRYSRANLCGKINELVLRLFRGERLRPREYLFVPEYTGPEFWKARV